MSKHFHVCIGCLVKIPTTKKGWDIWPHLQTVCDTCFFDIAKIISKKDNAEKLKAIKAYQKTHATKKALKKYGAPQ